MIEKWKLLKSEMGDSNRVFSIRNDTARSPVTGKDHVFHVIDAPSWINVVALTPSDEVLLITQYRHGIRSLTTEIPGGMIDPGEKPLEAAKRELLEETGYESSDWVCLGEVIPNPAIQDNKCYTFLARSSVKVKEPEFDNTEDIETFTVPLVEIPKLIREKRITHSLVIAGFHLFDLYQDSIKKP